jgi:hypothetical protein
VYGINQNAASGTGIRGVGYNYGCHATGVTRGVYGNATATNGTGVYGYAGTNSPSTGTTAGVFGNAPNTYGIVAIGRGGIHATAVGGSSAYWAVYAAGDLAASGTKYFIHPHPTDPSRIIKFVCLEGNENGTYFRGKTRLVNRRAEIDIPVEWQEVTAADSITVQVTAIRSLTRIAVMEQTRERIVVIGDADCEFNYVVNGVRRGFTEYEPYAKNNDAFRPTVRGVPFGTQYPKELRDILVANGILQADYTPNEATAAWLGWNLIDAADVRIEERHWLSAAERSRLIEARDERQVPVATAPRK